jgi:hypothetical protein
VEDPLAPVAVGRPVIAGASMRRHLTSFTSGTPCAVVPVGPSPAEEPSVTVVVLCYRYGHFLRQAVGSALSQAGVRTDVVIVDDASPDGSGDVAADLAAQDDRVQAIVLPSNVGPMRAFNTALERVEGKYLVRLDADDLLTPGALARATALLEAHPEVGFVYGTPARFSSPEPPHLAQRASSWTLWNGPDWVALRCRRGVNCMTSPEVVIRSSLQCKLGGQRESLGHTHDMEMWLRAAAWAGVGRVNGAAQGFVRVHSASRTMTTYTTPYQDLEERVEAFELALAAAPPHVSSALAGVARQTLAREAVDRARHAYERSLTDVEPVAAYLALARRAWPPIVESDDWRTYERRARWGSRRAPYVPVSFVSAARRGVRHRLASRYWRWTGL